MTPRTRRPLLYAFVGVVTALMAGAAGFLLIRQGIDRADKIASIVSMVIALVMSAVSVWQIRVARRGNTVATGESASLEGQPSPGAGYVQNITATAKTGDVIFANGTTISIDARRG